MVQVHTVYEASAWRNKVDGLQQGTAFRSHAAAVAEGRAIALELGCTHDVHDVDGRVVDHHDYASDVHPDWVGPVRWTA